MYATGCLADEKALLIDAVIADRYGNSLHSQGDESLDFDIDDCHSFNRGNHTTIFLSHRCQGYCQQGVYAAAAESTTFLS